jgi:hypothetical protein
MATSRANRINSFRLDFEKRAEINRNGVFYPVRSNRYMTAVQEVIVFTTSSLGIPMPILESSTLSVAILLIR